MTDRKKPETIGDQDLEQALGGGVFQTPAGGWGAKGQGVWKAPAGTESDAEVKTRWTGSWSTAYVDPSE